LIPEKGRDQNHMPRNNNGATGVVGPAGAAETAAGVLTVDLPQNEESVRVGERTYVIQELPAAAFLEIGTIVSEEVESLAEAGLLREDAWTDLGKDGDYAGIVRKVALIWKRVPRVMGRLLALVLSAEEPDDPDYILRHLRATQLLAVVRTFMRVNPWGDLVEGFFQLREEWGATIQDIREKQPTS
jgi:hypothetical protein